MKVSLKTRRLAMGVIHVRNALAVQSAVILSREPPPQMQFGKHMTTKEQEYLKKLTDRMMDDAERLREFGWRLQGTGGSS